MNFKMVGCALCAAALVAGCGKNGEEKDDNSVAVSVNGKKLTKGALQADVATILKAQGDKIPAERVEYVKQTMANQLVQSFIIENALVAKAKAAGFTITDADRKAREADFMKAAAKMPNGPKSFADFCKNFPLGEARAREEFESGILIDKLIKSELAKAPAKDYAAEAKAFVANIVSNNASAQTADAAALKKIKALKAQLDKVPAAEVAKKFAELAKANSACPSSQKGGDLGEFTHGQMVKEFDEVSFKLPVGKVSDPFKTQFGYHIVLTTKKTPAVAAKGDKPATPEKVQASHILIKGGQVQTVPKTAEVIERLKKQGERSFTQAYLMKVVGESKLEASEEFKHFLPADSKAPAAKVSAAPQKKAPAKAKVPAKKPIKKAPVDKPAAK